VKCRLKLDRVKELGHELRRLGSCLLARRHLRIMGSVTEDQLSLAILLPRKQRRRRFARD